MARFGRASNADIRASPTTTSRPPFSSQSPTDLAFPDALPFAGPLPAGFHTGGLCDNACCGRRRWNEIPVYHSPEPSRRWFRSATAYPAIALGGTSPDVSSPVPRQTATPLRPPQPRGDPSLVRKPLASSSSPCSGAWYITTSSELRAARSASITAPTVAALNGLNRNSTTNPGRKTNRAASWVWTSAATRQPGRVARGNRPTLARSPPRWPPEAQLRGQDEQ